MRDTTGSVPDDQSRGRSCAALSRSERFTNPFPACTDPNCPCAACMHRCTLVARAGGIPTNGEWWKIQGVFPVVTSGVVVEQVDGFFAKAVR